MKIVEIQTSLIEKEITAEDLIRSLDFHMVQIEREGRTAIFVQDDALYLSGLDRGGDMDAQCADLLRYQCAEGVFELQLLAVV